MVQESTIANRAAYVQLRERIQRTRFSEGSSIVRDVTASNWYFLRASHASIFSLLCSHAPPQG